MPYHDPGEYLTSKNRYAQMLMQGPNYNTGTTTGGLAHLLQQGLSGFMMGQDRRDKRMATQALTSGMGAKPWVDPDTGESVGTAGGVAGAISALSKLDNEPAGRLVQSLRMGELERGQAADVLAEGRRYKEGLLGAEREHAEDLADRKRSEKLADLMDEREFKKEMKGIPQAMVRKPGETERRVNNPTDRGFSLTEAQDIAAGRVRLTSPDQYGNVYLVNVATGEKRLAGGGDAAGPSQAAAPAAAAEPTDIPRKTMAEAARGGTGPWSNLKAAVDAVVGGVLDIEPLFPDTTDNRKYLRTINQIAKTALVNNPRFPVAEQEIVQGLLPNPDTFFTNPQTEARNVAQLRNVLTTWKEQNNISMASGSLTQKAVGALGDKNAEIERILALIGGPVKSATGTKTIGGKTYRKIGNEWFEVQ